jgi:hypothetical protein
MGINYKGSQGQTERAVVLQEKEGGGIDNNYMPLLCYIVKHLFCIPPILVVWWYPSSQTGALATARYAFFMC